MPFLFALLRLRVDLWDHGFRVCLIRAGSCRGTATIPAARRQVRCKSRPVMSHSAIVACADATAFAGAGPRANV